MKSSKRSITRKRHLRIRKRISGTAERPRLCVFKSNNHMYAQIINDETHHTLVSASTLDEEVTQIAEAKNTCEASAAVGTILAQRALDSGIVKVVFDRGGNLYHGRVKALADSARSAGLEL